MSGSAECPKRRGIFSTANGEGKEARSWRAFGLNNRTRADTENRVAVSFKLGESPSAFDEEVIFAAKKKATIFTDRSLVSVTRGISA